MGEIIAEDEIVLVGKDLAALTKAADRIRISCIWEGEFSTRLFERPNGETNVMFGTTTRTHTVEDDEHVIRITATHRVHERCTYCDLMKARCEEAESRYYEALNNS